MKKYQTTALHNMLIKFHIVKTQKSLNRMSGILSKNQFYKPFTSSPNDPRETVDQMKSLLNDTNKSTEEVLNQMNLLVKNEQNNKNKQDILSDIGNAFGYGLFSSLYLIAMVGVFAGIFNFAGNNMFMTFVCFVLFMTLLLPTLA